MGEYEKEWRIVEQLLRQGIEKSVYEKVNIDMVELSLTF